MRRKRPEEKTDRTNANPEKQRTILVLAEKPHNMKTMYCFFPAKQLTNVRKKWALPIEPNVSRNQKGKQTEYLLIG